jgi:hypothetical protein
MKNKFALTLAITLLIVAVLGCSKMSPFSAKSKTTPTPVRSSGDTPADGDVLGDEKIGVPECDDVMDELSKEANSPDDNYLTKTFKAVFLDKIRESIRKAVEDNKKDNKNGTADLAKTCTDIKKQLEKYKAEEQEKKGK